MFKGSISYNYGQKQAIHYYLANYIPANHNQDQLSKSLLRFKRKEHNDLAGWIDFAQHELNAANLTPAGIIVRAQHSYEGEGEISKRKPLDDLGNGLALTLGWEYDPELIQKLWPTQKAHHLISIDQRKDEFRNNYAWNELSGYVENTPILIIDDIVTTGTTMTAILNALDPVCSPENLITFSLALTTYDPALNSSLHPQGEQYSFNDRLGWIKRPIN